MKRISIRLADGRELIYFDRRSDTDRGVPDTRTLPGPPPPGELRHDPLLDEWVAVASYRQDRSFLPSRNACPLCPSTPGRPTEIPAADYEVVVFENRFPAFGGGHGRCEVVCFTPEHDTSFAALTLDQAETVVAAWADRTTALSRSPRIRQVFCFENRGVEIGVTLQHPHGQIYGYPFLPPRTDRMLGVARRHLEQTGNDLFAEVLAVERAAEVRIVTANAHWTAFVPAAARWPFEVHLFPHRKVPDIPALTPAERRAFVEIYLDVLGRFERVFDVPLPYVAAWHQAPVGPGRDLGHLHLQLFSTRRAPDRLKYLAGSESAMGVFINDVAPETAARLLRAAS